MVVRASLSLSAGAVDGPPDGRAVRGRRVGPIDTGRPPYAQTSRAPCFPLLFLPQPNTSRLCPASATHSTGTAWTP